MVSKTLSLIALVVLALLSSVASAQTVVSLSSLPVAEEKPKVPHNLVVDKASEMTAEELKQAIASGDMVEVPKSALDPTHTYTHGPLSYAGNDATFTSLDGNPPDPAIGYSGDVQVRGGENPWWGMITPNGPYNCAGQPVCGWGFPNGGFNVNNTVYPLSPGPFTLVPGSCTVPPGSDFLHTDGCSDTSTTTVVMEGYALGQTYTEVALYQVHKRTFCGHGRCSYAYTNDSASGNGTTSYTPPQ